jgi:hypothetical protein
MQSILLFVLRIKRKGERKEGGKIRRKESYFFYHKLTILLYSTLVATNAGLSNITFEYWTLEQKAGAYVFYFLFFIFYLFFIFLLNN